VFPTINDLVQKMQQVKSPLPFGIHRVPDDGNVSEMYIVSASLHCLSAFTAFPTPVEAAEAAIAWIKSPLPFGIHRVPDGSLWM